MNADHEPTALRLVTIFLMGVSVGICLMVVYISMRERPVYIPAQPAAEQQSR